ncbi:MAG: YitT family protein [Agathobacter sp.]|nr:YitT family protein [Agathobacter sp.]
MSIKDKIIDFVMITLGTAVVAVAVFFFMVPSNVSVGSIAALAMIFARYVPLSIATLTFIMNVALLIFGFVFIGKEFGVKTVYTALLLPTIMGIFEVIFPNNQSLTNDQTLDVICYICVVSMGQSMLFVRNASSGGLDIVGKFMNKYLHMEIGKAVGLAGMVVALASILVADLKTVILSVLGTYFGGIILDHFIFGTTIKKRVCIISKKEKEILDFILHELHSGATKYHAYGTYSDTQHIEINTIVDKNEYLKLMNFITKVDPSAFVTVYAVNEMRYIPKEINEKKATP